MNVITCTKCRREFPATTEFFHIQKEGRYGLKSKCKQCRADYHKEYEKTECGKFARTKINKRRAENGYLTSYMLWHYYGMSPEQYDKMLKEQGNGCAICGGVNVDNRRLAIDHNHETGKIRGLLCHYCNIGLGCFKDDVKKMKLAIKYLANQTNHLPSLTREQTERMRNAHRKHR